MGIIKIEKNSNSLIDVKLKPDLKKIELNSNNLEKIYNTNFKNNFSADHTNIININKIMNSMSFELINHKMNINMIPNIGVDEKDAI